VACKGVDLSHPQWILVNARPGSDALQRLIPADQSPAHEWPTDLILERDRSFWKRAEQMLALHQLSSDIPEKTDSLVQPIFEDEPSMIARKVFGSENLKDLWVAFALPYQAPRLILKHLHYLFNIRAIITAMPRDRLSAIEAPIALAIEGVACRAVELEPSPRLLLLTGQPPVLELTAATLDRENDLLRLETTGHATINPDDVAGSLGHLSRGSLRDARLVHPGIPAFAEKVAGELGLDSNSGDVIDLGPHAVAIGAIRHGGLLTNQLWVGNRIDRLEIKRASPTSLGILGTNRVGEWFWRRLIERGTILGQEPIRAGLNLEAASIERMVIAECPDPLLAGRRWLSQDEWPSAGLRWHEIIAGAKVPENGDLQMSLTSCNRERWHKRTICPHWKVVAPREEPDPSTSIPEPSV
jgi:hypothetical protein